MEHPFFSTTPTPPPPPQQQQPPMTTVSSEAIRWLTIAEKLLQARDFIGSRSFAARARESDPSLIPADQILAVAETLIAGDKRINNQYHDYYSILQLGPHYANVDAELIASQYRRLALLLNPQKNGFAFAEQAFRLVLEAWSVLSNPSRKLMYDKQLAICLNPEPQQPVFRVPAPSPPVQQQPVFKVPAPAPTPPVQQQPPSTSTDGAGTSGVNTSFAGNSGGYTTGMNNDTGSRSGNVEASDSEIRGEAAPTINVVGDTFWTACPFCYHMYEYPKNYADCTLRCQNCKLAFHAVVIQSPPPIIEAGNGQEGYFCCWGFVPAGYDMGSIGKNLSGNGSGWTPFSPMFMGPSSSAGVKSRGRGKKSSAPRIYYDDDDVFVEISSSEESDDEWNKMKEKKKGKGVKGKKMESASGTPKKRGRKPSGGDKGKSMAESNGANVQGGLPFEEVGATPNVLTGDSSKKTAPQSNVRKQPGRVAKDFGKLDLNVEFSNEAEDPPPGMSRVNIVGRGNQVHVAGRGEEDTIEENGFFEGLDEFLSGLPILNVVGDDKVKAA